MFVHRNLSRYINIHVLTILGLLRSFALVPYLNFQTTPSKYIPTLVMNGKKIRFLIFLRCRVTRRFWIYLLLIWLFFDPIIKPPKKDYKRKNQKHLCFGGRFAFLFKRSFFGLRVRYFSLGSSYQLPKDWSIKLEKKVKRTKKILCQIIAYERPSLDDKHVFQLLGLLLLQANHSKNSALQVTFFPSSISLLL